VPVAGFVIREERRPGDDALIVDLHRRGYVPEGTRFGAEFCAYVGETVAEAGLDDPHRGRVWFAERDGAAVGCAALIDRGEQGQLRWVVLLPEGRGFGAGRILVERAIAYSRNRGHYEVFLETTDGLPAAMAIYEKLGFELVSDEKAPLWKGDGRLIVMRLPLASVEA
jgi:GNAT superfamily N-acetyltransferase